MKRITLTITLRQPVRNSINTLHELASIWGLRVIRSSTNSPTAIIEVTEKTFERIFAQKPRPGSLEVPDVLAGAFASILVSV